MTMLNRGAPERQEIEALLPWHAAGTLNHRDSQRVERALASDHELARSFARVREEQHECIHLNESLGAPSARAMEKLFATIDAESAKTQPRRSFDIGARVAEFIASFSPRTLAYAAAAAVVGMFAQGAVLATFVVKDHGAQSVELASFGEPSSLAVIRFSPQATSADITRLLETYGASMVDGPKRGQYTVRIGAADAPQAEVTKTVQKIQSESKIVEFIATK